MSAQALTQSGEGQEQEQGLSSAVLQAVLSEGGKRLDEVFLEQTQGKGGHRRASVFFDEILANYSSC